MITGKPTTKTIGQLRYEADLIHRPTYHDGSKRRAWNELPDYAKRQWER